MVTTWCAPMMNTLLFLPNYHVSLILVGTYHALWMHCQSCWNNWRLQGLQWSKLLTSCALKATCYELTKRWDVCKYSAASWSVCLVLRRVSLSTPHTVVLHLQALDIYLLCTVEFDRKDVFRICIQRQLIATCCYSVCFHRRYWTHTSSTLFFKDHMNHIFWFWRARSFVFSWLGTVCSNSTKRRQFARFVPYALYSHSTIREFYTRSALLLLRWARVFDASHHMAVRRYVDTADCTGSRIVMWKQSASARMRPSGLWRCAHWRVCQAQCNKLACVLLPGAHQYLSCVVSLLLRWACIDEFRDNFSNPTMYSTSGDNVMAMLDDNTRSGSRSKYRAVSGSH